MADRVGVVGGCLNIEGVGVILITTENLLKVIPTLRSDP